MRPIRLSATISIASTKRACIYARLFALTLLGFFMVACTARFPVNQPLTHYDPETGYRLRSTERPENAEEVLVFLAFSGGGTRSAALAYGLLEQLAATRIGIGGKERRLLDEVDIISAVSGGSFTAAYYGLFGDRIFKDFKERFLNKNLDKALTGQLFVPANWARLVSSGFSRADLAARYYDKHIFEQGTIGDIAARKGPVIIINATDISLGTQFTFLQFQFDFICSDVSRYPVARAVAASSAVPFLFTPITLRNYAGRCDFEPPPWFKEALREGDPSARPDTSRNSRYVLARNLSTYLHGEQRKYIHLVDGGLSDNLGVRGPMSHVLVLGDTQTAMRLVGFEKVRRFVFFIVNAEAEPNPEWEQRARAPKMKHIFDSLSSVTVRRQNAEVLKLLRRELAEWETELRATHCPARTAGARTCDDIGHYVIEISFDLLPESERSYFKQLPTAFKLPPDAVDALRGAAGKILGGSPEYRRLLRDLRAGEAQ